MIRTATVTKLNNRFFNSVHCIAGNKNNLFHSMLFQCQIFFLASLYSIFFIVSKEYFIILHKNKLCLYTALDCTASKKTAFTINELFGLHVAIIR